MKQRSVQVDTEVGDPGKRSNVVPHAGAPPRETARVIRARNSFMTRTWSPIRAAAAAAALLGGVGLAAPAAAQGVIGPGSGRAGATVAVVVGLIGAVVGGLALARSVGRTGTGNGRNGAIVALVLGLIGMVLAGLHLATSTGGIGTGNGRGGAIVALVLGLIDVVLGRLALVRSRRSG
ncbi:DUF6223 family protein [Sorangium sp. So ce341]